MKPGPHSLRALILTPGGGRDAQVAADLLRDAGQASQICADIQDMQSQLQAGAGLALVAEEALLASDLTAIGRWVAEQPSWSDFPFLVLTLRSALAQHPVTTQLSASLGNVTFVERPFHPTSLLSLVQSAVRGRRRQYEARARIEDLRLGQEQLRFSQEAGRIGTFELEPRAGMLTVSPAFCRIWGLTQRPAISLSNLLTHVVAEDREGARIPTPNPPDDALDYLEYRINRPDTGEVRWLARQGEPMVDAETGARRFFGVTYDITERKRTEESLRESRDRLTVETRTLELLNRTASGVAAQLDLEKVVQQVVDAGVELTGAAFGAFFYNKVDPAGEAYMLYALAGAPREAFAQFPMPRNTALFTATFAGLGIIRSDDIRQDPRYGHHAPHHGMPPGHLKVVSYLAVPVVARDGQVIGGLFFGHPEPGIFTERSERAITGLTAQAATAIDNARLFQTVQNANATLESRVEERTRERDRMWRLTDDLMAVCTADGRLTAVNRAWTTLLGWPEEDLLAIGILNLVHADDVGATQGELARLNAGAGARQFETQVRERTGGYRHIAWTAAPEDGLIYAIGRDITGQRLVEDQLRQSQKMEAIGQLSGGIAHDFNNLLQGIMGSLDVVQRRVAQGRAAEAEAFVTAAMTSAQRAAALTHRLLAFSRRQPLDPRPVRVNPLVSSMADMLRRTLGERVELDLSLQDGLWQTRCDPNQLENAILNLCLNARDAMPEGGTLTIETRNVDSEGPKAVEPGPYVRIAVTDTGTGMPADVLKRAFDPFFTTKPLGQGTGLGLSMIYGFARQSEGHAKIASEVGQGTTVSLYLPGFVGEDEADAPAVAATFTVAPAETAAVRRAETVLVVEDEKVVRGLITEVLADLGYQALEAADGPEGLEILRSTAAIDLLVTDIGLPGLNGRQVADAGRQLRPDLKVLFMTGYAENAAFASGFLEPGMEMITKPFPMETLAQRLRHILEG
ncbi:MAG: response regulator [Azospirillaceae bacterium]|nr:response regulator [Azospirillaceae bacterium]